MNATYLMHLVHVCVSGQCTIELSRYEDFRTICRQGVVKADQSTECSAIVEFDDLDPSTTWYHRAYLHNPRKGFDGPVAGFFVKGMHAEGC